MCRKSSVKGKGCTLWGAGAKMEILLDKLRMVAGLVLMLSLARPSFAEKTAAVTGGCRHGGGHCRTPRPGPHA